ncbi:uncharacterized protein [Euwallacea similis]|uniref:uncharacterized protein isoform X2 n=1 Tax=Euwallacea similis TaxID=1736056 RepID=UPI003450DADB
MDQNKCHQPTEESQQFSSTEDLSQESSEYSSTTQLHPQSDLSLRASSRVLRDANVETLPEGTSRGTILGTNQDINLLRENLCSPTEDVVDSGIPLQDVVASALQKQICKEPLRDSIEASEQTQGPHKEVPDQPGAGGRPADHLQEFMSKYSAVFHTIISDFSNFVNIVRLFTNNPKVLLAIVQMFIDNPEALRSTSKSTELTLPQPDQSSLNQHSCSGGVSELDINAKNEGESTVPNLSQLPSNDLGRTGGDLNVHINLLTKFDELKEILLHLQETNVQGDNDKSVPGRKILGDSALTNQMSCSRPLEDTLPSENESTLLSKTSQIELMQGIGESTLQIYPALERSHQSEIEPPSQKGGSSSDESQPGSSKRPSVYQKQNLEDKSDLPAKPNKNSEQHCPDHYTTKDSVAREKSQQLELEFSSQEVEKSSELQEPVPTGGESSKDRQSGPSRRPSSHREQTSEFRGGLPVASHKNVEPHHSDRNSVEDFAPRQKSHSGGVIKWFIKPTDDRYLDVNSDSSISLHSSSKNSKSGHNHKVKQQQQDHCCLDFNQPEHNKGFSDNREHAAALQRSNESEIESPSRKAEDSSEESQLVPSRKPSDHRKQSLEEKSILPTASDANVEEQCEDRYSAKDSVTGQKSHQSESDFHPQEVVKSSEEQQQLEPSREGVIRWFFKPTDSRSSDVPSHSSSSEDSTSKDKNKPQDSCNLDYSQTEPSERLSDNRGHVADLEISGESEIEFSSRKVEDFSEKLQPGFSKRQSDYRKRSSEDRSNLLAAPDSHALRHCTDRHSTKDSTSIKKSQQSESEFPLQKVKESSEKQQLEPSGGVIKWSFKPADSRSSEVPSGSLSHERSARNDDKSLEHIQRDKNEPQCCCPSDPSRNLSDNQEHAAAVKTLDKSKIAFPSRKVGEPCEEPQSELSEKPSDHQKQSSEDRSIFAAAPDENVEQRSADYCSTEDFADGQKSHQSESEFPLQEVEKLGKKKQLESSERSLPCQFTNLVTEEVVKWFFKLTDTTISVVDCNSSCSDRSAGKDVKSPGDTHKHKKEPQGPCHLAFNQPGSTRKFSDNREPVATLDTSDQSEIDFPSRKVDQSSEEPQPGPSTRPLDHRKQSSENRSILPAAPDKNVELLCPDHYSTKDSAARQKSHQLQLELLSQEVRESSEEQRPGSSEGRPSSPSTDLLTDEVVKWFFQLNNSIKSIIHSDSSSSERFARKDIKSSGHTHKDNKEPPGPCHLALDQPGPSTRLSDVREHAAALETSGESEIEFPSQKLGDASEGLQPGPSRRPSEHRGQISEGRSGLAEAPEENLEHRYADFYSTKDSATTEKSHKSKSEFTPQEVGESSEEQRSGSKEGRFFSQSTDSLIGEIVNDSDRPVGKDFNSIPTDQDPPPSSPEEKSSPLLLNVGNVNELLGHLNGPPISITPCDVCHLHPMQFHELNFWYQLHWKLIIDGRERNFESQAKPIVLVNSSEADQHFQEIKSKMSNLGDDADKAHQKPHRYKKGRKEKKRNF